MASLQASNYECKNTGEKGNLVVYHADEKHIFYIIVQKTFELTGLPLYSNIGKYFEEQLNLYVLLQKFEIEKK